MKKFLPFLLLSAGLSAQNPNFDKLVAAGDAKYSTKSYKLAYTDYDNALKIISADLDKMVAARQQAGPDQKNWINALTKRARCAYFTNNTSQAVSDAEKLLAIDSSNADGKAMKAHSLYKSGNKIDGCRALKKESGRGSDIATKIYDDCFCWSEGVAQYRDANSAFSLAKNEPALEHINKAIDILPDSLPYHIKKAEILMKMEKYNEAISILSSVINKDNKLFKAYFLRGQIYSKAEKNEEAFADLSECLKLNKFSYEAYYQRAEICMDLKQFQSAIYDLQECIRLKPDNAELHYKIALIKKDDIQDELGGCAEFIKAASMGYEEAVPYAEECKHPTKKKKK